MKHSPAAGLARLSSPDPGADTPVVVDTAVAFGGSFVGFLAVRVLSDHAVTVERKTDL